MYTMTFSVSIFISLLAIAALVGPVDADNADGNATAATTLRIPKATIGVCVGLLYGDDLNLDAFDAWMLYHKKRWEVTHANLYLREKEFQSMGAQLKSIVAKHVGQSNVRIKSIRNWNSTDERRRIESVEYYNCLLDAKARNFDYLFVTDADEYLVSQEHQSIRGMFNAGNASGISFPIFINNYNYCSQGRPTFDAATYQKMIPVGSKRDPILGYTDPPSGFDGQRKYVIRPERFDRLESPHVMHPNSGQISTFDGRDGLTDARIVHFRTATGIHSDSRKHLCENVIPPKLSSAKCRCVKFSGECTSEASADADLCHVKTEVSDILDGFPLSGPALNLFTQSACYAKRYPDLYEGFCGGRENDCRYRALINHYEHHTNQNNLIFGCSNRTIEIARPVGEQEIRRLSYTTAPDNIGATKRFHLLVYETEDLSLEEITPAYHALTAGIPVTVIGRGIGFEGFGSKWTPALEALESIPPSTFVIIIDSRDTLLNLNLTGNDGGYKEEASQKVLAYLHHVESAYETLTRDKPDAVIISAEAQCCVSALTHASVGDFFDESGSTRRRRACSSGRPDCAWLGDTFKLPWESFQETLAINRTGSDVSDVYLNAGAMVGRAEKIIEVLRRAQIGPSEDDQAVLTDLMFRRPDLIVLDYAQEIMGTARWASGMANGCIFEENDLGYFAPVIHQETRTTPFILHFPGKFVQCYEKVAEIIAEANSGSIPMAIGRRLKSYGTPGPTAAPIAKSSKTKSKTKSPKAGAKNRGKKSKKETRV